MKETETVLLVTGSWGTWQLGLEDSPRYQTGSHAQLTLIVSFSRVLQMDGLRKSDLLWIQIVFLVGLDGLQVAPVLGHRQNEVRPPRHVDFTPEQRVVVAAEVKGHGV